MEGLRVADHRRDVRTRPRARRRAASTAAPVSPLSRAAARPWSAPHASGPTCSASSPTCQRRTTPIRSRYRRSASWVAWTSSSTTRRRSGPRRWSRSPTPNAKTWSSRSRPTWSAVSPDEGPAGIARRVCPGGSAPAGGERVERRCGNAYPAGAPMARARRRSIISAASGTRSCRRRDSRPVRRPGRHGHAAARARRARCGPLDPETPGTRGRELARCDCAAHLGATREDAATVPEAVR